MKNINRILTNICSDNLSKSKHFYKRLFDFNVDYDSDWFVHLVSKDKKLELGIIDRTSEIIPKDFQNNPQGFYITFVVDAADEVFNQKDSSMALPRGFRSTSPWERSEFPFLEILGEVKHKISIFALKGKMKSAKYLYGSASRIVDFKKFFIAKMEKFEIIKEPEDTFYGQRRLLLKDPDGTLVDVSSPIEGFEF